MRSPTIMALPLISPQYKFQRPFARTSNTPIRLITFNIRHDTLHPVHGEHAWLDRREHVCAQLRFITTGHDTAFICLQEVLYSQLIDIMQYLNQSEDGHAWKFVGVGRDDGGRSGEFSPILYRSTVWTFKTSRVNWLSWTTGRPSRIEGAHDNSIATIAMFRLSREPTYVVVMNTHLDSGSEEVRKVTAYMLCALVQDWRMNAADSWLLRQGLNLGYRRFLPIFLAGSLNSERSDNAYQVLTAPGAMADLSTQLPRYHRYGNPEITYTSFCREPPEPDEVHKPAHDPKCMDFLFVDQ